MNKTKFTQESDISLKSAKLFCWLVCGDGCIADHFSYNSETAKKAEYDYCYVDQKYHVYRSSKLHESGGIYLKFSYKLCMLENT